MFDIPIGARHIVIEENETSPHIIGESFLHPFPAMETHDTIDAKLQNNNTSPLFFQILKVSCSCVCM